MSGATCAQRPVLVGTGAGDQCLWHETGGPVTGPTHTIRKETHVIRCRKGGNNKHIRPARQTKRRK